MNTLGPPAVADTALRQALLTYVQCGFNTIRVAANLYAHRNIVERRVSRANEISAVKVEENPTHVAVALLLLDLAPDIGSTDPSWAHTTGLRSREAVGSEAVAQEFHAAEGRRAGRQAAIRFPGGRASTGRWSKGRFHEPERRRRPMDRRCMDALRPCVQSGLPHS
ncbi:helix-turn-helix domain-containing protein [Streptomyces sp. NPDC014861]|uniref:helix-turn-helix domain-containing protein n=1 Tax=Streptomyces sp. NPDC014861 TaxID=3364923 RepID=UPI0036F4F23E